MRVSIAVLAGLSLLAISCTEAQNGNQDSASEVSCVSATGIWTLSAATCNDAAQTVDSVSITFNSATSASQSQGVAACASSFNWDILHGSFDNSVSMTGNGNLSCTAGGSSVSSCTDAANNCDSSTDVTGVVNNFETCAISGTSMTLIRTVSSVNDPSGNSYCANGEVEVITLTQAASDPTGPASLSIAGANPYDFGSVTNGGSADVVLTLSNDGGEAATVIAGSGLAAPFSFVGGSYPGTGGTCPATLAAGASCTMTVRFSPTANGLSVDSLVLNYNDGSAAQSLSHDLQGTGTSVSVANITISESDPYNYGSVPAGASSSHVFTLTNTGSGTATSLVEIGLAAPFSFTGGIYPGTAGTCAASLASAASCDIEVEFAPVALGAMADTITIQYNNGVSAVSSSRDIQGVGVAPAVLTISEVDPYDFGTLNLGMTSSHTFTVTNTGGFVATAMIGSGLASPFNFTGGSYPGVSGTCGFALAPGASCTMDVTYAPIAVSASDNDTIGLPYDNGVGAQVVNRAVTGTAIP